MFEGMDFGMYGIDPNLLQKQMDLQNFQKEAASHAMMQQGNPAAVGAGIAAAAGTLLGKNLQRLTGIRDPEVEKVAQAQKAAEIMKSIEGDTPSEYYRNASEAMKEFSPSLAASLGLKARQADWEEKALLRKEQLERARIAAYSAGAGGGGGPEFFSTTSGQISTKGGGVVFGLELREKGTGKLYYRDMQGNMIDPSTVIGFTSSSGSAGINRAIADEQAAPYANAVDTLGDNSKSAIKRAWEIARVNGEITEEEYEKPLSWMGNDYDYMNAKLQQIRQQKQSWGNMAPSQEAFQQGVPARRSGNYIDLTK